MAPRVRAIVQPPRSAIVVEVAPLEPYLAGLACVRLPQGATLAQAFAALGIALPAGVETAVWGRPAALSRPLKPGDRIEFTRPLAADPKAARRDRARR